MLESCIGTHNILGINSAFAGQHLKRHNTSYIFHIFCHLTEALQDLIDVLQALVEGLEMNKYFPFKNSPKANEKLIFK